MEFEWDDNKNAANTAKHGLSFYEAQTAFLDKNRIIFPDVNIHQRKIGTSVSGNNYW